MFLNIVKLIAFILLTSILSFEVSHAIEHHHQKEHSEHHLEEDHSIFDEILSFFSHEEHKTHHEDIDHEHSDHGHLDLEFKDNRSFKQLRLNGDQFVYLKKHHHLKYEQTLARIKARCNLVFTYHYKSPFSYRNRYLLI